MARAFSTGGASSPGALSRATKAAQLPHTACTRGSLFAHFSSSPASRRVSVVRSCNRISLAELSDLAGVQNPEHYHAIANHLVEDLVWESPQKNATKVQVLEAFPLRILLQLPHRACDCIEELVSQPRILAAIPVPGLCEIALGFRPDEQEPTHESVRSRAST